MKSNFRVLVAGASGYLGGHLVQELLKRQIDLKALARSQTKLMALGLDEAQIELVQLTEPSSLIGCCDYIDLVISCVGITRQKEGLKYMDVDYQANLNLLLEAERAGVKKFIYISAFNALKYQDVRLLKAKERFAARLLTSDKLLPCVIRPNGFFSDLEEFYAMAKSGRVYLFGLGDVRLNPIHGEDLALFCIEAMDKDERELDIGGPEILSAYDIAALAFNAQSKAIKVTHLPSWSRVLCQFIAGALPEKWGGAAEFFLTAMAEDMLAPLYGNQCLATHFRAIFNEEVKSVN